MFGDAHIAVGEILHLIIDMENANKSAEEILKAVKKRCDEIAKESRGGWY